MVTAYNSVNNTKAIKTNFFERPSDAYVSTVKLSTQLKLSLRSRVEGDWLSSRKFFGGAKSIVMQISFVRLMFLLFSDQISGGQTA